MRAIDRVHGVTFESTRFETMTSTDHRSVAASTIIAPGSAKTARKPASPPLSPIWPATSRAIAT